MIRARRHQQRFKRRRRPAAQFAFSAQRGHQRHDDRRAARRQISHIVFGGALHHDRFALQLRGRVAPDCADVTGNHIGPVKGRGRAWRARCARLWKQAAKRRVCQLLQRRRRGLIERAAAAHARQIWQGKIHQRIGVAQTARVPIERLCQAAVIQPRHDQHALLGKNARLRPIGQDHAPAFQSAAHAAAIDDGSRSGGQREQRTDRVRQRYAA